MTELLLLTPTAILVGYLLWQADRRTKKAEQLLVATLDEWTAERKADREAYETERKELLEQVTKERADWTKERSQLLNRIQQPATAVYENFEPSNTQGHVPFDDDEAVWEAMRAAELGNS